MVEGFAGFSCWDRERMSRVVLGDIAALAEDADPVFLALHTPLPLYLRQSEVQARQIDENEVSRILLEDADENVVIAITGHAGSGKSHLVRWLKAHIQSDDSRKVIYVPRLRTGVRSVLELILTELEEFAPDKVAGLRAAMTTAADSYPGEAIHDRLLDELKTHLKYRSDPMGDAVRTVLLGEPADGTHPASGRVGGLSDLMLNPHLREHLLRTGGPIRSLVEQFFHRSDDEESGELAFSADDLAFTIPGSAGALDAKLRRLYGLLKANEAIRSQAADVLNDAAGSAVASVLGMRSGPSLVEIVADARVALKDAGRDLVLLIEDMYKVGAEDLYELFVEQPVGGQCLLRVAYAITPDPFLKAPETVRSRLKAHIDLSHEGRSDVPDDARTAREVAFIGRYLNVARLGHERIAQAWAETPLDVRTGRSWVPNFCDQGDNGHPCPYLDKCRDEPGDFAFGHSGDDHYGLYPFNEAALSTALRALRGADGIFNPRTVIKDLVRDFLPSAGEEIARGDFPSDASTSPWLAGLPELKSELEIVPEFAESDPTRRRVLNYRRFWMGQAPLAPPAGPAEAFRLGTTGAGVPQPAPTPPLTATLTPTPGTRPIEIEHIARWQAGDPLPDATSRSIRDELLSLVRSRVDWATHSVTTDDKAANADVAGRLVGIASFDIEGGSGGRPGQRLAWPMKRSDRSVQIFDAIIWFREHGHWVFDDGAWGFPGDGYAAQLELESFVDRCAADVARRIDELRDPDWFPPYDAAVRMLALIHVLLNPERIDDSPADVARAMLLVPIEPEPTGYGSLDQVRRTALSHHEDLRKVVLDLAAVRVPGGEYQAVDLAALVGSVESALDDLAVPRVRREDSPVVASAANALQQAPSTLAQVARDLRDLIAGLPEEAWSPWSKDLLGLLKSVATRAYQPPRVFTPASQYAAFHQACEYLEDESSFDLSGVRTKATAIGGDDVRTVALLLPHSQQFTKLGEAVGTIGSCLEQTLETTRASVENQTSVDVDSLSRQLAEQLRSFVDLVRGFP